MVNADTDCRGWRHDRLTMCHSDKADSQQNTGAANCSSLNVGGAQLAGDTSDCGIFFNSNPSASSCSKDCDSAWHGGTGATPTLAEHVTNYIHREDLEGGREERRDEKGNTRCVPCRDRVAAFGN